MISIVIVSLVVGFLVGCTGMGGIILIPALVFFLGMSSHLAMGTALFSFAFLTAICSWLYYRLGHMDFKLAIPISVAALPLSYAGAVVKAYIPGSWLNLLLALLILLAGALVFRPAQGRSYSFMALNSPWRLPTILGVGGGVAFIAGMTGAGGPVLSTPLLIVLGFPPIATIAAGQMYSVAVSLTGSIGNFQYGAIDWEVGITTSLLQTVGMFAGVYYANRANTQMLRKMVAWVCLSMGSIILVRSVLEIGGWNF